MHILTWAFLQVKIQLVAGDHFFPKMIVPKPDFFLFHEVMLFFLARDKIVFFDDHKTCKKTQKML